MLEGMVPAQARAVQAAAGGLLLYCPVVRAEELDASLAYLARRFDENTTPDNFLRAMFGMRPDSAAWRDQEARFRRAVAERADVDTAPRRPAPAADVVAELDAGRFANEPDTDFTSAAARAVVWAAVAAPPAATDFPYVDDVAGIDARRRAGGRRRRRVGAAPGRRARRAAARGRRGAGRRTPGGDRADGRRGGQDRARGRSRGERGDRLRPLRRRLDAAAGCAAARRRARRRAVELPLRHPCGRRPRRADGRQRRHPQARPGDPAHRVAARAAVPPRRHPARRPAVRRLPRRRRRPAAGHAPGGRHGRAHRRLRHRPAVPRLAAALAPAGRDERQERDRRHRRGRRRPGDPRHDPLRLRSRRPEVLGGEPADPDPGRARRAVPAAAGRGRAHAAGRLAGGPGDDDGTADRPARTGAAPRPDGARSRRVVARRAGVHRRRRPVVVARCPPRRPRRLVVPPDGVLRSGARA